MLDEDEDEDDDADSGNGGGFTLDDTDGVVVYPEKADGIKCRRSWKYFAPSTADPAFPDITPRDALTVKAWEVVSPPESVAVTVTA